MFNYKYVDYFDQKKKCRAIKAISSYEGKTIVGIAYLHPDDVFNPKKGMEIAKLRCEKKLLAKKRKRFLRKMKEVDSDIEFYTNIINRIKKRKDDYKFTVSKTEFKQTINEESLNNLLKD